MKFLLDECLPRSSGEVLRLLRLNFISAKEAGLLGKEDINYINFARKTGRILITLDKGFGNPFIYKPGSNPGIIIIRPKYPASSHEINKLLYKVFKRANTLKFQSSLTVITPTKIRIRR